MIKLNVRKENRVLLVETSKQRVVEVFFKFPDKEFSLSDLAKEAGVAKAHIGIVLDELRNMGFIDITKLSKIWRIRANVQNQHFIRSKIVYNLNFVSQSGLVEFLDEYYRKPKAIVLFGSFRRGEDGSSSDIDIAIETDNVKEPASLILRQIVKADSKQTAEKIEGIEKAIKRNIQIFVFNRASVDLNVFNNIANGIVLMGFLEVQK